VEKKRTEGGGRKGKDILNAYVNITINPPVQLLHANKIINKRTKKDNKIISEA
jgi:hypothetical protein